MINPHITVLCGDMGIYFSPNFCMQIFAKNIRIQQKIIKNKKMKGMIWLWEKLSARLQ